MANKPKLTPGQMREGINRIKFKWIDQQMKALSKQGVIPKRIYDAMRIPATRHIGKEWLERNSISITHEGDIVSIMKADKALARMKLTLNLESPQDFIDLVEGIGGPLKVGLPGSGV